ncbi:MAG: ribonuclease H [Parcubacteria group bacterium Gr01-1014_56]|nr:MAG: ribonuclease H [Parcubacteria group bacterium Gr01-1014_56]
MGCLPSLRLLPHKTLLFLRYTASVEKIIIYTDGGARGNPGPAGIGVVISDAEGKKVREISEYIGKATNNYAEYEALVRALIESKNMFGEKLRGMQIEVRMDSELVVRQLTGLYKVKEPGLKEQFARIAMMRLQDAPNMTFTHIPREKNAHADELVNKAIDAAVN